MDAMKLHQRHHLIYSVNETGLKLTYNSGKRKLLAVKGSISFTVSLTMVYNMQNYWDFELCSSSSITKTTEHNVSETGSVSFLVFYCIFFLLSLFDMTWSQIIKYL
jgi:hypothetical protein